MRGMPFQKLTNVKSVKLYLNIYTIPKKAQLSLNTMRHLSPAVRYLNRSWMTYSLPWIPAQPLSSHQLKDIIKW